MEIKLFDSELKIMEILWREGGGTAKKIAEIARDTVGWSKTTTYTVIKKCIKKGAVERREPQFTCRALLSLEEKKSGLTPLCSGFSKHSMEERVNYIIWKRG